MAAGLALFLLWLFATGKYKDWAALVIEPEKKVSATAATAKPASAATAQSVEPSQLIRTGSDWLGQLSGSMMVGGDDSQAMDV